MEPLNDTTMLAAIKSLSSCDPLLARLHNDHGTPPLWSRPQSFATLVHIILEQKVSLTSANAVMQRVRQACPGMQPGAFLKVPDKTLRDAGLSASKLSYCHTLAEALVDRSLSLPRLRQLDDEQVLETLTSVRGVGPWTAGVYLMMALRRQDAWASGDRALAVSYFENTDLDDVPSYKALDDIAVQWMPYRGTAARLLWHAYLEKRRLKSEKSEKSDMNR